MIMKYFVSLLMLFTPSHCRMLIASLEYISQDMCRIQDMYLGKVLEHEINSVYIHNCLFKRIKIIITVGFNREISFKASCVLQAHKNSCQLQQVRTRKTGTIFPCWYYSVRYVQCHTELRNCKSMMQDPVSILYHQMALRVAT